MTTPDPDRLADAEEWVREFLSHEYRHGTQIDVLMKEYDRRGAVVDAARALLRTNGDEPEWAALRVALYELEGDSD